MESRRTPAVMDLMLSAKVTRAGAILAQTASDVLCIISVYATDSLRAFAMLSRIASDSRSASERSVRADAESSPALISSTVAIDFPHQMARPVFYPNRHGRSLRQRRPATRFPIIPAATEKSFPRLLRRAKTSTKKRATWIPRTVAPPRSYGREAASRGMASHGLRRRPGEAPALV